MHIIMYMYMYMHALVEQCCWLVLIIECFSSGIQDKAGLHWDMEVPRPHYPGGYSWPWQQEVDHYQETRIHQLL